MASRRIMMSIAGLAILTSAVKLGATEDQFIYVNRMPEVRGEHQRTIRVVDEERGQTIMQDLYREDFEHALIETYILKIACDGGAKKVDPEAFIIAFKYPPKKPETFAVATLHDIYKDVYVRDGSGRIRLYEDVHGQAMLELSERFRPDCLPI